MTIYAIYLDGSDTATAYAAGRMQRDKVIQYWDSKGYTVTWKALKR